MKGLFIIQENKMPEEKNLIYAGKPENFHYVALGSGSGTNINACAEVVPLSLVSSDKPAWDPGTGKGAKVAETDPEKLRQYGLEHLIGIPRLVINGFDACGSSKTQPEEVYKARSHAFNQMIVDALHKFEDENCFGIDLIVLGGYMRMMGTSLLEAYPDKIINVHPADLSILYSNGKRVYTGGDAVYDAIKAGATSTRSSVILVDGGVDHGEIITQGPELMVEGEFLILSHEEKERQIGYYAKTHQDRQKEVSDWPALTTALKMIAEGRVALSTERFFSNEWRRVYVDGLSVPYSGFEVKENTG